MRILKGAPGLFRNFRNIKADGGDFVYARQPDGSEYARWSGWCESLIAADGRTIRYHSLNGSGSGVFQWLIAQAVSYALLKQGLESLHATSVLVDGAAIAFLGDCGTGKSTLGAAFLQAGYPLLSDDLLVLTDQFREAKFMAYPGLARIKLFPEVAQALLGTTGGVLLHPLSTKRAIRLVPRQFHKTPAPLRACYCLHPSATRRIVVRRLSPRQACLELIANSFNLTALEPKRRARHFAWAAGLADNVPVRSVTYPRTFEALPLVRQAILDDLKQ